MKIRKILILGLVLLLAGCSNNAGQENVKAGDATVQESTASDSGSSGAASTESASVNDQSSTAAQDSTETQTATETQSSEGTGVAGALANLTFEHPTKLMVETDYETNGIAYLTKHYIDGDSYRLETNSEGMPFTLIYNSQTQKSYMVNDDDKTVMPMESGDMGLGAEMMEPQDIGEDSFDSVEAINEMFGNYEIQDLDGEEVLYVESQEEDGLMKIWISTKYGYPLKMELYNQNQLIMKSTSKISTDFDSNGMFDPPADYQIIDLMDMMNLGTEQN